tara:strand:- start:1203 stop:1358 length:156 start_codon:yes stop_codon:yes gene_type:complete
MRVPATEEEILIQMLYKNEYMAYCWKRKKDKLWKQLCEAYQNTQRKNKQNK